MCTCIMIGNMTRWVFHVIMLSWCHVIWNHLTLEFHLHMWILSSMENISYSSDLISVHGFDIYHLIYMLCIFAVYFYLLRAHWEHFARDGYTSCTLGTWIHSITSCALGTLRVCWVHFMCVLGILIYDNTLCALGLLIRDIGDLLYLNCILFLRCWYICYDYDIQWIQGIYICFNFHLCFWVCDFCRSLRTLW